MLAIELIKDLTKRTKEIIDQSEKLDKLTIEQLNTRKSPDSWSALECFEHLNRYSDFYIPEIDNRIKTSKHQNKETFKSGWLGNYFANSMLPKEKLNKMKTFKSMNPIGSSLDKKVLNKFISDQHTMLELLEKSKQVNLQKTKTSISISNLIKLRLGDTFRVVIYHNQRHLVQVENVLN